MPEKLSDEFSLLGDPESLAEDFFEALAALLLDAIHTDASEKSKEDAA